MHQAIIAVGNAIRAQATVMAYADCFEVIRVILLSSASSAALLRKAAASGAGAH